MQSERYISLDEEGYFAFDGRRVDDDSLGRELIQNLKLTEKDAVCTTMQGQEVWVEAFDAPLVGRHVRRLGGGFCEMDLPYHMRTRFHLDTLCLDEWDRFHGRTTEGVPFVFSRTAQYEFFDLLDSFDDESVTLEGKTYPVPPWLVPMEEVRNSGFWTDKYQSAEKPGWELGRESVVLPEVLPQLKLGKCRVLVPGCGSGHDAAYFARLGHVVTGVDFSEEAIQRAKSLYGHLENLTFERADVFALPPTWNARFDLVFEHTLYCAVSPEHRSALAKVWNRVLHSQGHLLGIFFVMERRLGPPFGGSEWEVRERLGGAFDFLYWTRWRRSVENRRGLELVVFARKKA
ncbi:MAG: methyltransferase domain-containing protein [Bdellovibrionales bacterium]